MEKYGKTAVFLGGYGRILDIPHGRLWPDWGLKGYIMYKLTEKCIKTDIESHNIPFADSFSPNSPHN